MTQNVFEVLGLPARFDLTGAQIEGAYLARAAGVHPDLVDGADVTGDTGEDAARLAAVLNDARRVVEDPESRAGALLAVLGGPSKEADKSLPPGFLMEIMEVRQEVEAAEGDAAKTGHWRGWAREQRAGYVQRVGAMFSAAGNDPAKLRLIRTELNAWRYIERLIEQLGNG